MGRMEMTSLDIKSGKEKNKHKQKGKQEVSSDELERDLCMPEVGNKMNKEDVQTKHDKTGRSHMNIGEGANKKKKRKREKEVDENTINKTKLLNDWEESVGKPMEKLDSTGHVKKRKKILEDVNIDMGTEHEDGAKIANKRGNKMKKNKKKVKSDKRENVDSELEQNISNGMEAGVEKDKKENKRVKKEKKEKMDVELDRSISSNEIEARVTNKRVDGKERKEKRKLGKKSGTKMQESVAEATSTDFNRISEVVNVENSKKRKKSKLQKHDIVEGCNEDNKKARSSKSSLKVQNGTGAFDNSEESAPKKARKRVRFADDVEVFTTSNGTSDEHHDLASGKSDDPSEEHQDLVRGKRFTKEEDKIVEEAVLRYVEEHALGDEGLDMVLHSRSNPEAKNHPELKTCWKEIGADLPYRPLKSVYSRAHILFERAEKRKWSPKEYEEVRKFHKEKGADWRTLGDRLGKSRIHIKDAWRRIKLPNLKKGHWSQEEYENLFDLVNKDLRMKIFEQKKTKHGMLRDNICWEAISETLGNRTNVVCNQKWYSQLTSPLVSKNLWSDVDDYRLLNALNNLDACCIEDVEWDDLLEHRPGDVCRKRWYQMVKHIGQHVLKSFPEQVEVLSKRYLADLIEAREIYANKPAVD